MLSVDHARWGQAPEDLRRLAMSPPHRRTRERFLALHEIARGGCATRVAVRAGRHPQTVMGWLHAYNAHGPDALALPPHRRPPPFCAGTEAGLGEIVRAAQRTAAAPPVAGAGPAPRRTLERLVAWARERFGGTCCRETIRAALHRSGLSWKKAKKPLGRADPARRRAFVGHSGACWPTPSAPGTSWSTWTRRTSTRTPTSAT